MIKVLKINSFEISMDLEDNEAYFGINFKDLVLNFNEIIFEDVSESLSTLILKIFEIWYKNIIQNQKFKIFLKMPIIKNINNLAEGLIDLLFFPIIHRKINLIDGAIHGINSFIKKYGQESYNLLHIIFKVVEFPIPKKLSILNFLPC